MSYHENETKRGEKFKDKVIIDYNDKCGNSTFGFNTVSSTA